MPESFLERRRTPRIAIGGGYDLGVPQALSVRVIDISTSGVLLSSPQKMEIGQRARLHTTLGPDALAVEVEVRRIGTSQADGSGRYRLGAVFVSPDEPSRKSVKNFLRDDIG